MRAAMFVVEGLWQLVGEKDAVVEGIRAGRVYGVAEDDESDYDSGEDEGVLDHSLAAAGEETGLAALELLFGSYGGIGGSILLLYGC